MKEDNAAFAARAVAEASPVTPAEAGFPSHNLTTRIWNRPVSCLTRRVCKRIFQTPGLRKHPRLGH